MAQRGGTADEAFDQIVDFLEHFTDLKDPRHGIGMTATAPAKAITPPSRTSAAWCQVVLAFQNLRVKSTSLRKALLSFSIGGAVLDRQSSSLRRYGAESILLQQFACPLFPFADILPHQAGVLSRPQLSLPHLAA